MYVLNEMLLLYEISFKLNKHQRLKLNSVSRKQQVEKFLANNAHSEEL